MAGLALILPHEGEPLPPPHAVLLHLTPPAGTRGGAHVQEVSALPPVGVGGELSLFTLYLQK